MLCAMRRLGVEGVGTHKEGDRLAVLASSACTTDPVDVVLCDIQGETSDGELRDSKARGVLTDVEREGDVDDERHVRDVESSCSDICRSNPHAKQSASSGGAAEEVSRMTDQ